MTHTKKSKDSPDKDYFYFLFDTWDGVFIEDSYKSLDEIQEWVEGVILEDPEENEGRYKIFEATEVKIYPTLEQKIVWKEKE